MVRRIIPLVGLDHDMVAFLGEPSADLDVPVVGWGPDGPVWIEGANALPREVMLNPTIDNPPEALHLNGDWLYFEVED